MMGKRKDNQNYRLRQKLKEYSEFDIIYKLTLKLDNRIYIGQTVRSLKERITEHSNRSKFYINNAIHKYGIENFYIEIIEKCDSQKELDGKETYWIKFYKSNIKGIGFNLTEGGDHGSYNEEVRKKISESQMGENNSMHGHIYTEEERKRRSDSAKKVDHFHNCHPVLCIETNKIYNSLNDVVKDINISLKHLGLLLNTGKKFIRCNLSFKRIEKENINKRYAL
jgi:hypothetical protein